MELEGCLTRLRVIVLDKNLISEHHNFFCLGLPFLHPQIHSSAVRLLSCKKHCWKVLEDRYFACKAQSEGSQGEEVKEGLLKVSKKARQHRTA